MVVFHKSVKFSGKAEQINWSAVLNWGTVLASVAACDKTPAFSLKPDNPVTVASELEPLNIGDEVEVIWLVKTGNLKQ